MRYSKLIGAFILGLGILWSGCKEEKKEMKIEKKIEAKAIEEKGIEKEIEEKVETNVGGIKEGIEEQISTKEKIEKKEIKCVGEEEGMIVKEYKGKKYNIENLRIKEGTIYARIEGKEVAYEVGLYREEGVIVANRYQDRLKLGLLDIIIYDWFESIRDGKIDRFQVKIEDLFDRVKEYSDGKFLKCGWEYPEGYSCEGTRKLAKKMQKLYDKYTFLLGGEEFIEACRERFREEDKKEKGKFEKLLEKY